MAKKMCKCAICGKEFDRNAIQAVRHGARRYSHWTCKPNGELVPMEKKDEDLQKLLEYINTLFKGQQNQAKVNQSIKKFHNEFGYSYSGIQKALYYFYEIKHNSIDKANGGISIVPFVYKDAYNYYYDLFMAQRRNENKKPFIEKVREIIIKPPKVEKPVKLFDLDKELGDGEE